MIFVISPAKALDYTTPSTTATYTHPAFLDEAAELIGILCRYSPAEVAALMQLSDTLAALNVARYASWSRPFSPDNAKQAILAFNGDVYDGLAAPSMTEEDLAWAQSHVRILSGLYGILRPLDLMQPYRLEMGTRLRNARGANLYAFWGDRLAQALNQLLANAQAKDGEEDKGDGSVLVNLASEEYFKAVRRDSLKGRRITPVFEDWKGGRYKIISFYAKRARGLMVRYAVLNRLKQVEGLKNFDSEGYAFCPEASEGDTWVFRRQETV